MGSIRGSTAAGASLRLAPIDGSSPSIAAKTDSNGAFAYPKVSSGWYILSVSGPFFEGVKAVRVDGDMNIGAVSFPIEGQSAGGMSVLTVCEAFERRPYVNYLATVIVGIFKSGMDETLRLDCPRQLVSGELGWPSSIGLTRPAQAPDEFRAEVEKKRQEVMKSSPPEAPLRPERVVGLYGIFVSLAGLTTAPCCSAAVETVMPPGRLFGVSETDLRVIR